MERTAKAFLDEVESLSTKRGLYHPYKYLNYAASFQKPFEGHAASTRQLLESTSSKYDPDHAFQKKVPGGYKIHA